MHDYISQELPGLIAEHFPVNVQQQGVTGFSMGGHGALIMALRHPQQFQSVSALAPIAAPSQCPWGINAYNAYIGPDTSAWRPYDSCALIEDGARVERIRVDQGANDEFLPEQLCAERLQQVCQDNEIALEYTVHEGYDHSFYFVAAVMEAPFEYHAPHWRG
jgi:S-formylglutathione hydrolase